MKTECEVCGRKVCKDSRCYTGYGSLAVHEDLCHDESDCHRLGYTRLRSALADAEKAQEALRAENNRFARMAEACWDALGEVIEYLAGLDTGEVAVAGVGGKMLALRSPDWLVIVMGVEPLSPPAPSSPSTTEEG